MIGALLTKDIKLFFRNQFFAVISVLGLVAYLAVYYLMPAEVNDGFRVAMYFEDPAATPVDEAFADGFEYTTFDSEAAMIEALEETGEYFIGVSVSKEQADAIMTGSPAEIDVFYAPGIPAEIKSNYDSFLKLIVNTANPSVIESFEQVNENQTILGRDIYDTPIPLRDRMIPMLLLFLLSIEVLGLATLIVNEIESGTARALVTSPLRLGQFFSSKVLMGLVLAFSQVLILIVLTGKIAISPVLLLTTLLIGSLMIVGFSFIIAAMARDAMSVIAWGFLIIIAFAIPGMGVMLPGLATGWAEAIPSFYLVDTLHGILNFNETWADVGGSLMTMTIFGAAGLLIGSALLRRRF